MNIVTVVDPVYSAADNSTIDVTVTFDTGLVCRYTCAAVDDTTYGQAMWAGLQAGTYGTIGAYVPPAS